jgi:Putative peptidoglycan binding domain
VVAGRGARALVAAFALLVLTPAAQAATPGEGSAAGPLDGNGMWIWYVSRSGGTAEAIADQASDHRIDTVYLKSGDGDDYWGQFSEPLVEDLKEKGLRVCAWPFAYGEEPRAEARVAARAVEEADADCLIIDAESHYEGRYEAAEKYVRALRRRIGPRFPLGLTSFPYVDYHPQFPYSVFLGPGAAQFNIPQIYWEAIGTSVRAAFAHTYPVNRPYGRPIYPLGQTWQDPGREEILDFRRYARAYRAAGISWWSWQETSGREWRWVGRILGPRDRPLRIRRGYVGLAAGARGDLAIWAQQLLRAAGQDVRVDGSFGDGMERAVLAFQREQGLEETGIVEIATWKALLEREPVVTRWSRRGEPRALRARPLELAPSPPLDFAPPATPGRP